MKQPKLIWVDGPTAVGKGHFIQSLVDSLRHLNISLLNASTFVTKETPQELRKYSPYSTSTDDTEYIFIRHTELLRELQQDLKNPRLDLIILDRSFMSYLIYNLHDKSPNYQESAIELYSKDYTYYLNQHNSIYIQLQTESNQLVTAANTLIDRIKSRQDNKPINEDWIYKLLFLYHTKGHLATHIYPNVEYLTSSDHLQIVNKYFTTHSSET